jgi:predicted aldo/keto reductase-like oxidoreductase
MIYNEYKREKLSALGLRITDGAGAAAGLPEIAVSAGVNYYESGCGSPGSDFKAVCGALSRYPREGFLLAAGFPGHDPLNTEKADAVFETQLKECGVSYFDFYAFEDVSEATVNGYLNFEYGVFDHLMKQRVDKRIRHLGLSTNGAVAPLKRFLDSYGQFMEFCRVKFDGRDNKETSELLKRFMIPVFAEIPEFDESLVKSLKENPGISLIIANVKDAEQLNKYVELFK